MTNKSNSYVLNMAGLVVGAAIVLILLLSAMPAVNAAKLGWVLHGTIISAETCNAISNATIWSQYNNYASNISAQNGNYTLVLGTGNWTVGISAKGYYNGSYKTLYETNGALLHNFAMLPEGGKAGACVSSLANTTVFNASAQSIASANHIGKPNGVQQPAPTLQKVNASLTATGSSSSQERQNIIIWSSIAVVILIAIVLTYLHTRKPKEEEQEQHDASSADAQASAPAKDDGEPSQQAQQQVLEEPKSETEKEQEQHGKAVKKHNTHARSKTKAEKQ
jgi:hypothetical protein